jgi:predicted nucleotidyltransferase
MLRLSDEEQRWLDSYKETVMGQFPHLVQEIRVFGSKARGESSPDSDLDVLVVISHGSWEEKDAVASPGHLASVGTSVVPSFLVLTREEWTERERKRSPIWRSISRDGVTV